jgi:hypothetical protein
MFKSPKRALMMSVAPFLKDGYREYRSKWYARILLRDGFI